MTLIHSSTLARATGAPSDSAGLITDWARRVVSLSEHSRDPRSATPRDGEEWADACRVRDELDNRLTVLHPEGAACTDGALETLQGADALFLQFTVESTSADSLSQHNHYSRRSQWWWRRHQRLEAA